MRIFLALVLTAPLAGCLSDSGNNDVGRTIVQSSVFAQPSVVYHTGDNLEISYYVGGIQHYVNEQNAIALVKKECGGAFRITNRSDSGGTSYIDAVCVH